MDGGRPNQKTRTRKDLLDAAARLLERGRKPSLEEIAEEALVSRATAYRYFPNVEALLVEASFDITMPRADELFSGAADPDPVSRMQLVDTMVHDVIVANEASLRMMLVHTLQQAMKSDPDRKTPVRQNRRIPLIEGALKPVRDRLRAETLDTLTKSLAFIIGTEGMVVIKDVLQLDDADARKVKHWAIRALIQTAMADAKATSPAENPRHTIAPRAAATRVQKKAARSRADDR